MTSKRHPLIAATRKARSFPDNTCPASRHAQMIGEALVRGEPYPMIQDEPEHVGEDILATVCSLYMARTLLIKHGIDPASGFAIGSAEHSNYNEDTARRFDASLQKK